MIVEIQTALLQFWCLYSTCSSLTFQLCTSKSKNNYYDNYLYGYINVEVYDLVLVPLKKIEGPQASTIVDFY